MSALAMRHNVRRRAVPMSTREATLLADESLGEWNARYPVGTPVKAYRLLGDETSAWVTHTTSEARVIGGISTVVDVAGCEYALYLTHVVPLVGASSTVWPNYAAKCGGVSFDLGKGVAS